MGLVFRFCDVCAVKLARRNRTGLCRAHSAQRNGHKNLGKKYTNREQTK